MSFPLYFDEHVPFLLAKLLRDSGHDVLTALDAGMAHRKYTDETQLRYAADQGRAILTFDTVDYTRLAHDWFATGLTHSGIIVTLRRSPYEMRERILAVFEAYPGGLRDIYLHI